MVIRSYVVKDHFCEGGVGICRLLFVSQVLDHGRFGGCATQGTSAKLYGPNDMKCFVLWNAHLLTEKVWRHGVGGRDPVPGYRRLRGDIRVSTVGVPGFVGGDFGVKGARGKIRRQLMTALSDREGKAV